jgi:hypothetical protein
MKEEFYNYVKNEIKRIPNSSSVCLYPIVLKENEFLSHIDGRFHLELINFNQDLSYESVSWTPDSNESKVLRDTITYHYKVNNQLYLEYNVICNDLKENYPYILQDMIIYSNDINKDELISFIEYINDYLKNK